MANLDFGTHDLSSDFDMANLDFPSLSFSVDHDDLTLMARMGSLFDIHAKDASTHNGQTTRQPPQYTQGAPHSAESAQQPVQFEPASFSPTSCPEFACLSQPMVSQQKQSQQVSGQQSLMPSFPQAFVSTAPASQQLSTPFALNSNTSFDSDGSHQKFVKTEEPDSYISDEQSDPDDTYAATPRRSSRKRNAIDLGKSNDQQQDWLQQKKKVGRPITYNGDPNAPELTEAERRRVKRRIANRESARRVQQRRKEMIDELQHKLLYVQHHHHHLLQYLTKLELEKGQLTGQLTEMKARWGKSTQENTALNAQLNMLQQQVGQQDQQAGQQQQGWRAHSGPATPDQTLRSASPAQKARMTLK